MKPGAVLFLLAVFGVLVRLVTRIQRSDRGTDLAYLAFTTAVTNPLTKAGIFVAVAVLLALAGVRLDKAHVEAYLASPTAVSRQPVWLQGILALVLSDLLAYWLHRLFHRRPLWPFHAVHHSSTRLDWLSSVRVHPLNEILPRLVQVMVLFLIGFRGPVLAGVQPFLVLYALLLHADLPWTFGPFRHVIASPVFHRWHHTSQEEGLDRNFSGFFPAWDLLFGTFYLPEGRRPERFGVAGDPVPEGIWRQLTWPFTRKAPA